ncbi:MAG: hypothetical protein GC179_25640 [Anaerolineaceae bacterium]|nr:hypothetical protein [Anaerolineaceae bacterium]
MRIEAFDVNDECKDQLKKAGFSNVDEIAILLQQIVGNATLSISWGECFEEVVDKLQEMGLLPNDF